MNNKLANLIETKVQTNSHLAIRLAGDSGDGIQVSGQELTKVAALSGHDIHTFPDFPAEIRAPAGTLAGVSGFQLHFANYQLNTPGDAVDILVALNPAALVVNIGDVKVPGGIVLIDVDKFLPKDMLKVKLTEQEFGKINSKYQVFSIPINKLTINAVADCNLSPSKAKKCKNMLALGVILWLVEFPIEHTAAWIQQKFAQTPDIVKANLQSLRAGYNYAQTAELFISQTAVFPEPIPAANLPAGRYRYITGNQGIALACSIVATRTKLQMLACGYPITPASDILQELTLYTKAGIKVVQAEDEIASCCLAIGASFNGALGFACTSGPGMDLKMESLGLAIITELPLVIVNVQRAGPSTGMPTKTEQADLLSAVYGRHGEAPLIILAPQTATDCFAIILEAYQIAMSVRIPVIVLSDAFLANSAQAWKLPSMEELPKFTINNQRAIPGDKGQQFQIGGLEKDPQDNISYDPLNHQIMCKMREEKLQQVQVPDIELVGAETADVLVISWGSTYGPIKDAIQELHFQDKPVAWIHLRYLNPFPNNLQTIIDGYKQIIVPEHNLGQLSKLLNAKYNINAKTFSKLQGKPFQVAELINYILGQIS